MPPRKRAKTKGSPAAATAASKPSTRGVPVAAKTRAASKPAKDSDDADFPVAAAAHEKPDCGICLEICVERGIMDGCEHVFCHPCLIKWSKLETRCPSCRAEFRAVTKFKAPKGESVVGAAAQAMAAATKAAAADQRRGKKSASSTNRKRSSATQSSKGAKTTAAAAAVAKNTVFLTKKRQEAEYDDEELRRLDVGEDDWWEEYDEDDDDFSESWLLEQASERSAWLLDRQFEIDYGDLDHDEFGHEHDWWDDHEEDVFEGDDDAREAYNRALESLRHPQRFRAQPRPQPRGPNTGHGVIDLTESPSDARAPQPARAQQPRSRTGASSSSSSAAGRGRGRGRAQPIVVPDAATPVSSSDQSRNPSFVTVGARRGVSPFSASGVAGSSRLTLSRARPPVSSRPSANSTSGSSRSAQVASLMPVSARRSPPTLTVRPSTNTSGSAHSHRQRLRGSPAVRRLLPTGHLRSPARSPAAASSTLVEESPPVAASAVGPSAPAVSMGECPICSRQFPIGIQLTAHTNRCIDLTEEDDE